MNKITVFDAIAHSRYFENSGKYSSSEKEVLKFLRIDCERLIIQRLIYNPATTRGDLEKIPGISGPAVTRHMNHLREAGLLTNTMSGKTPRSILDPDARKFLEKYLVTVKENPADVAGE